MAHSEEGTLYPYVLDHKPGFFLSWFLYRLFKRVRIDESMKESLKEMHREGALVYAIKYRGHLDYLLYHYNFRRRRLPYPKIAFDLNMSMVLPFTEFVKIILSQLSALFTQGRLPGPFETGFYRRAIEAGTPALIFLVDPKGFLRHFIHAEKNHLQFLLETQKELDRPIFIVPQLVLYKKTPERAHPSLASILFGFKDNPGVVRKIALFFRYNRRAVIDFGEPLNLKTWLDTQPPGRPIRELAEEIRGTLIESIDSQKRVILGPIMKSRQQLKEIVLMDPVVDEKIARMGAGDPKKLKQLRKKAGEYFEEIAADFNMAYVQFFQIALSWLWKKVFEGIEVDEAGLAKVREWARRGNLIYVPSHKSHIDYLILNFVLHNHHMHIPRIAAGRNLAFWPMGYVFRKSGAFFIRRSFRNAKLYLDVFNKYIKTLLDEGHPMEFFIEGGRSRNGKLVFPKTGFLSILLQAHREGVCKDMIFAPVSIVYDRIMEEDAYLKEMGGEKKEQENLGQMLRARRFLKKRYGKIYIRFSEPISLNEYAARKVASRGEAHRLLAFDLVQAINAVTPVTPLSLIATAVLAYHRKGFRASDMIETAELLLGFLKSLGAPVADTLADPSKAVQDTLSLLHSWKVLETIEGVDEEEDPLFYVEEEKKRELEYYKNSIIHFFIPHALVAVSLLGGTEEEKDIRTILGDYTFLKDLFKHEFVFDKTEDLEQRVVSLLEYFLDAAFLVHSRRGDGLRVTKLGHDRLSVWAGLAKTFLESYWIAATAMAQQPRKTKREELLRAMDALGRKFHRLGLIDHIGAISRLNFVNALSILNEEALGGERAAPNGESGSPDRLASITQRLYDLSHYGHSHVR
ncbi:MAG: 1-acyl-sn-glycerol-3-phosphate acyltransferase [Deltaproteobacteria bacterium]|nr:1-acyl-sn-glycerol-3-phosphate acyltransferase [Deltaproteobacteria bacterium]